MAKRCAEPGQAQKGLGLRMLRLIEEILPFIFYFVRARKQRCISSLDILGAMGGPYGQYHKLSNDELWSRLKEEHERAKSMDEKTVKLTLALGLGLTILGSTSPFLAKIVSQEILRVGIVALTSLAVFYTLVGGLLALSSLKTLPTYGYGTDFLIEGKNKRTMLVGVLVAQEKMNILRHLRNESAYQCLRNGFVCLFAGLMIFVGSLVMQELQTIKKPLTGCL